MNLRRWLLCAAVTVGMASSSLFAAGPVSIGLTADFFTDYVWRGQRLNEDAVFQPGATATYKGFTGGVWGNMDLTDIHDERYNLTELDYSLGYAGNFPGTDKLSYSAGFIYYDFPTVDLKTMEVYAGLTWNVLLSPSVTVYYDFDKDEATDPGADDLTEGFYAALGVAHTVKGVVPVGSTPADVKLSASLGWADSEYNKTYWGVDDAKFNDFSLGVAVPLDVWGVTVTPSAKVITLVDGDIKDSRVYSDDSTYVVVGIGLAKTF